jgi:hypothetical protein
MISAAQEVDPTIQIDPEVAAMLSPGALVA